jgi:hypothetical protein
LNPRNTHAKAAHLLHPTGSRDDRIGTDAYRPHRRTSHRRARQLNRAIEALQGTKTPALHTAVSEPIAPKKKRHISAATRRKMALGQQRRYAAKVAAEK